MGTYQQPSSMQPFMGDSGVEQNENSFYDTTLINNRISIYNQPQNKNFASLEFNDMFSSVSSCDYTRVAEFKLTDKNTKRKFLTI